jgi:hypothetical protein
MEISAECGDAVRWSRIGVVTFNPLGTCSTYDQSTMGLGGPKNRYCLLLGDPVCCWMLASGGYDPCCHVDWNDQYTR